ESQGQMEPRCHRNLLTIGAARVLRAGQEREGGRRMLFRKYQSAIFAAALLLSPSVAFAGSEAQHQQSPNYVGNVQKAQSADAAGAEHHQSLTPGSVAGVQKAQTFSGPTTESWL